MNKFYDTCGLIQLQEEAFQDHFYISSITLQELENIKMSNKHEETRFKARQVLRLLADNEDKYDVIQFTPALERKLERSTTLVDNADSRILLCAMQVKDVLFITSDLACSMLAKANKVPVNYTVKRTIDETYKGYKIFKPIDQNELEQFYNEIYSNVNSLGLLINQYLIIKNPEGQTIDRFKWNGEEFKRVNHIEFNSLELGKMKPIDDYQWILFDSLRNEPVSLIQGKPGSGKSMAALSYMFDAINKGEYDRIYMFVNPVPVAGAQQLGFRPGDTNEKVLSSSVGNMLASHLGSMDEVERLIAEGILILVPMVDARGVSVPEKSIVYMTESQNTSISLMKLLLQRVEEGVKVIIDGDFSEAGNQIDSVAYMGSQNGMARVIDVFKDHSIFSMSTLQQVHRSQICELADKM